MTDNGEPGAKVAVLPDTYAIRVWETSGTYYQLGSATSQKALEELKNRGQAMMVSGDRVTGVIPCPAGP